MVSRGLIFLFIVPFSVLVSCGHGSSLSCSFGHYIVNGTCAACTVCGPDQEVLYGCTETSNRICGCKSGTYQDSADGSCQRCRQCPVGTSAERECGPLSDTHCTTCPDGDFLDVRANSCRPCTSCDASETPVQDCSAVSDTICISTSSMLLRKYFIRQSREKTFDDKKQPQREPPPVEPEFEHHGFSEQDEYPSIWYFVPFCVIIFVTSAYAAVKGYENHRHRKLNCSWTSLCYGSPTRQMPTQNANVADLKETRVSVQIPTDAPRPPTVTTAITPQSANDVHIPVPRNTDDDRRPRNSYFETSSHVKALLSLNNDFIPQPRPRIFTA